MILKIYTKLLLTVAVIIVAIWGFGYRENLPAPSSRSDADLIAAIGKADKELFNSNGQPIFTIKEAKKPTNNWYILKITPKDSDSPEGFIIINDPHFGGEHMNVVAGPESKFSREELLKAKVLIPSAVTDTLRSENAL